MINYAKPFAWKQKLNIKPKEINILFAIIVLIFTAHGILTPKDDEPPTAIKNITKLDQAISSAFHHARQDAKNFAAHELDLWIEGLMQRADNDFLEWYFGYWNQTLMELKNLYHETIHIFYKDYPSAAAQITEKIQIEFSKRVFRPQIAQMEIETITRNTVNLYLQTVSQELQLIPNQYKIPQGDWKRYLNDIAGISADVHGGRNALATFKTVFTSVVGGVVVFANKIQFLVGRIGANLIEKLAGKIFIKAAVMTSSKIAAKVGGKLFGPFLGLSIFAWDIWDHQQMTRENKPILRKALFDYLTQVKYSLLYDANEGIMSSLQDIEKTIYSAMHPPLTESHNR